MTYCFPTYLLWRNHVWSSIFREGWTLSRQFLSLFINTREKKLIFSFWFPENFGVRHTGFWKLTIDLESNESWMSVYEIRRFNRNSFLKVTISPHRNLFSNRTRGFQKITCVFLQLYEYTRRTHVKRERK